jgi:hypothetical protein
MKKWLREDPGHFLEESPKKLIASLISNIKELIGFQEFWTLRKKARVTSAPRSHMGWCTEFGNYSDAALCGVVAKATKVGLCVDRIRVRSSFQT